MTPAKRKKINRRHPTGGKRYEIAPCPFCRTEIYKRHLRTHIDQFHQGEVEKIHFVVQEKDAGLVVTAPLKTELEEIRSKFDNQSTERHSPEPQTNISSLPLSNLLINQEQKKTETTEKVILDGTEFLLAITMPGMPCTPDELLDRIREFIVEKTQEKGSNNFRIQID